jgi:hypothetical protein
VEHFKVNKVGLYLKRSNKYLSKAFEYDLMDIYAVDDISDASSTGENANLLSKTNNNDRNISAKYDNFCTVDFMDSILREKRRRDKLKRIKGIRGHVRRLFDAAQGWLIVFLVGLIIGTLAGFISVSALFLSTFKEGYCKDHIYLSKGACCMNDNPGMNS